MKFFLCFLLVFGPILSASARLGNFAEYGMLAKADIVILVDAADLELSRPVEGINPDIFVKTKSARNIQGGFSGGLEFVLDQEPKKNARSLIIYLQKDKDNVLRPINWMSSTIPSSLPVDEVWSVYQKHGGKGNMLDVVPDLFAGEKDANCALMQARILATGPVEGAKKAWILLPASAVSDAMALAHLQVGLAGVGTEAFLQKPDLNRDLSQVGVTEGGTDPMSHGARAGISALTWRNSGKIDVAVMLDFALKQSGSFQADIISGFAENTPVTCVLPLYDLLMASRHNAVRYSCFRAINKCLGQGKGDRGSYSFGRNPQRYIDQVKKLVDDYKIAHPEWLKARRS